MYHTRGVVPEHASATLKARAWSNVTAREHLREGRKETLAEQYPVKVDLCMGLHSIKLEHDLCVAERRGTGDYGAKGQSANRRPEHQIEMQVLVSDHTLWRGGACDIFNLQPGKGRCLQNPSR